MAPTLSKKLTDHAPALKDLPITVESARNVLLEPSGAQPQANVYSSAAKMQSTLELQTPACAFPATAWCQTSANNALQTTSSATGTA